MAKKSDLPKYDILKGPLGMFDFKNAGVVFSESANGQADEELKKTWNNLLAKNYKIILFQVDGNNAYFIFER